MGRLVRQGSSRRTVQKGRSRNKFRAGAGRELLAACPDPDAQVALQELEAIDPEAVQRASTFFPFTQFAGPKRDTSQGAGTDETTAPTAADANVNQAIPVQEGPTDVPSSPALEAPGSTSSVPSTDTLADGPSAAEDGATANAIHDNGNSSAVGGKRWAWSLPIVAGLVALVYLAVRFAIR